MVTHVILYVLKIDVLNIDEGICMNDCKVEMSLKLLTVNIGSHPQRYE